MTDADSEVSAVSSRRLGRLLAGRWELVEVLGTGSAGTVYRAVGRGGEQVAVKVLHPELAVEKSVRARFLGEAYVANRIEHEGVVRILEDGVDDDVPFLVMELLDGETLEARLSRKGGRLPVPEVLWAADHTLQILAAAHDRGVVHRDVKPENLFLTRDRRLKVLDFGIARFGGTRSETRVGTVLGTLAFMPPEQARGDPGEVGVRSDLWSVGATMYTLLSGRLVREDADVERLLREAGHAAIPSLRAIAPELPAQLAELVDLALLIDAQGRWSSAKAMRSAVRLVHAQIERPESTSGAGDDDDPVSEPSFGFIPTRSIDPPPVSRAATLDEVPQISRLPPPPPDLAVAVCATSLEASLREANMDGVEASRVPSEPGANTVPAPRPARRRVPPWVVTMVVAAVATLAVLAALSMR